MIEKKEGFIMQTDPKTLYAGYSRVVVTPPLGYDIPGNFTKRYADGVIDDLYLRCTALSLGDVTGLVYCCDALEMKQLYFDAVKVKIAERCNINPEYIYITCTHSHTAFRMSTAITPDELFNAHQQFMMEKFCECGYAAIQDLKPCTMRTAAGEAKDVAYCRLYRMKDGNCKTNPPIGSPDIVAPIGEQDTSTQLIHFVRDDAKDIMLMCFGTHASSVGGTKFSPDWPGYMMQAVEDAFDNKVEAMTIGGRTSESAIVGHVPAALTGIDFKAFIDGFLHMDELTRNTDALKNPAMMLGSMWYIAGQGKGDRNMVIVPYSDRLVLLSRYLQQLVMESLGKELDLEGKVCHQGLNVFGNKGGTDAHAFIQQLNDGRDDFFATFIEILADARKIDLGDGKVMGDYLHGFCAGLTEALRSKNRQTISIKIPKLTVFELGMIIALYERAVAIYAEFININAFHQPGVQAYKLAATGELELKAKLDAAFKALAGFTGDAAAVAEAAGVADDAAAVEGWLRRMAANGEAAAEFNGSVWIYTIK